MTLNSDPPDDGFKAQSQRGKQRGSKDFPTWDAVQTALDNLMEKLGNSSLYSTLGKAV